MQAGLIWFAATALLAPIPGGDIKIEGQTVRAWTLSLIEQEDSSAAVAALEKLGDRAVPTLCAMLALPDQKSCAAAARALGLLRRRPQQSIMALMVALEAQDKLEADESRELARNWIAGALAQFGPTATPYAATGLANKSPQVRRHCAIALRELGPAAAKALPQLSIALKDREPGVQAAAAEALGRIGAKALSAVPLLMTAATDAEADLTFRCCAVIALGRLKADPAEVVTRLGSVLRELPDDEQLTPLGSALAGALACYGVDGVNACEVLLQERAVHTRIWGCIALTNLGRLPQARRALLRATEDRAPEVRSMAVKGLGQIGNHADVEVLSALQRLGRDKDEGVRTAAIDALESARLRE